MKIEKIEKYNRKIGNEIVKVEKKRFGDMASDIEDLERTFKDKDSILIVAKENGKVIGYIAGLPLSKAYDWLSIYDKALKPEKKTFYVESIAILPGYRNVFQKLIKKLYEEVKKRGYKKIAVHARKQNKLSDVMQKRYGMKYVRTLHDWFDWGGDFDYLEKKIE